MTQRCVASTGSGAISCRDSGAFVAASAGHHVVEDPRKCWLLGQVVKERFAIDMIEGRLTGSDAIRQVTPGAPIGLTTDPLCIGPNAVSGIGLQRLRQRRQ